MTLEELYEDVQDAFDHLESAVDGLKELVRWVDGLDDALCFAESARQEVREWMEKAEVLLGEEERKEHEWQEALYRNAV